MIIILINCHFLFLEKVCGNLSATFQDGTTQVSNPAEYQDTANHTCNDGYWISSGVYSLIVTCTEYANWSAVAPTCVSKCDPPTYLLTKIDIDTDTVFFILVCLETIYNNILGI